MVTTEAMTDGNASFLRAARSGNVEKIIEHLKGNIDINTSNANGLNALHLAAKEGHVHIVTELLKRGANVNAATKKGNTALHIASLAGQEEVARVLVQLGANVNIQSQNGFTPLYMAAQENHDTVVSFLLDHGANQSLATEDGFTPLAVALQQGHDRVVSVLLENDTKGRVRLPALHIAAKKDDCKAATLLLQSDHNPDVTSKSGFTPLHIAAHYGNENIAKILLSKGADVNYAAKHQITPLHVASKWGKMNMVLLLLEKGANIDASTRDGLTPLHCAARSGHDQVVDVLLEKGAPFLAKTKNGLAPLHMASQGDHVDSARILLYHKAPVDDVTVDYLTALHVAAHCGHVKVAKLLLDRKADPNARALNGFTPLHIACKKNRIKVVELLLKHGASIEATTESGLTPLHVASFMGCMNIVIYLIQNGANPDVPTVRGETPLHLAARANQTDIIRILLRNGASVDARAREEQTPLHIAARLGNVDIVSLLLQHGAAVDATTKDMYTALHISAKEDQEEVASSLLDHGAALAATTKKGFTPLHLAAKYGNIKVARLLIQKSAAVDAQGKNGVTPLHVAAHYDHVNVALLLLDKGASPHAMAKNGYTPLHIAAKKNQIDIASTLLEYGAKTNSESKAGFTPLHLSSQEGHAEMSSLLIENKADVNHKANNGLTPLHLCAQDDRVDVAHILVGHKAEIGPQTKAGYTPLHVASHFGQINMVRFLLQHGANVHTTTSHGYTSLHQAAQQGHTLAVNLLLENQASPNVTTTQGQTPLSIAQRLGYISVVETLKVVTETTVITTTTTVTEEKYKVVAPETMQETFMTDSEDEGGADFDEAAIFGKPTHATHVYLPYVEGHNFHMSEEAMLGDQSYGYLTADEMKSLGDDSLPIDVTKDEKHHDILHSVKQFGAPMVEEDKLSPQHGTPVEGGFSEKYSPDNIDLERVPVHVGSFSWADEYYYSSLPKGMCRSRFLVSFMVDARGGAMRGCRHSGVRVIIPPRKASMPMRITCRYLRKEKLIHPPPLMEGEACASRILEMGPVGARFLGPVIIEVPHFASTRGKEREITILRSDTGETWKEHTLEASEEAVQEVLNESFEGEELSALEDLNTNRITRILTTDFPQYFAVVSRVRQEVHGVGPEGGMVSSTVVPQVQAIFPEGALTKKIRVGLQAQPIAPELVAKLLGNRVAVSPIVTVEPRRRKFHKPITLTIPVPQATTKGMINQYSGDAPTLRLLCSITGSTKSGGSSKAQWEDVTGSTPLTFVNDCVSFTTTVSARFWLMDCRQVNEVTRFATELYQEAVYVPFMSKFVIFAKRYDSYEAQLRVFCMTDDKEDKTLECQEHFTEVAKSRDVEVLEGKLQYLEFAGNIAPVTKSGEQLKLAFQAFHENRLPFTIRVKDPHIEPMGRIAFMREPKTGRGEPPQVPICNLNVALPDIIMTEASSADVVELVKLEKRYDFIQEAGLSKPELIHRADLRLSDIAHGLDKDWVLLAQQLDVSESDISQIQADATCDQPEQALMMLRLWLQKSGSKATGNELEKGLRKINREDIIKNCMFNVELVTDAVEKAVAKVHLDQSGFDVFKEELGSSREASMRRGASLDISYDEQDIMKEAESAAETSSETGSLFERDQLSQALTDDKVLQREEPSVDDDAAALFPKCKKPTSMHSENAKESSSPNESSTISNSQATPNTQRHFIRTHEFWPPDKMVEIQSGDSNIQITDIDAPSSNPDKTIQLDLLPSQAKSITSEGSVSETTNVLGSKSIDSNLDNETGLNLKNNQNVTTTNNSIPSNSVTQTDCMNIPNSVEQTVTSCQQVTLSEVGTLNPNLANSLLDNKNELNIDILQKGDGYKSIDPSDLGYCSMDKDSNMSPNTTSDSIGYVNLSPLPDVVSESCASPTQNLSTPFPTQSIQVEQLKHVPSMQSTSEEPITIYPQVADIVPQESPSPSRIEKCPPFLVQSTQVQRLEHVQSMQSSTPEELSLDHHQVADVASQDCPSPLQNISPPFPTQSIHVEVSKSVPSKFEEQSPASHQVADVGQQDCPSPSQNMSSPFSTEVTELVLQDCQSPLQNISSPFATHSVHVKELNFLGSLQSSTTEEQSPITHQVAAVDVVEAAANNETLPVDSKNRDAVTQSLEMTQNSFENNESCDVYPAGSGNVTNDASPELTSEIVNPKAANSDLEDARIRRASKTPPPSPVDKTDRGDDSVNKGVEILLSQSSLEDKLKDNLKEPAETAPKSHETAGREELPVRLTESETWPSLELDTSQVSISSLPDDERSEPTTATASDAAAAALDADKNITFVERIDTDEDFDDDALSPTKFKDLCSKKVSPTKSKIMLLTPEKLLNLQDLSLSPVKEVSEIETKETCTSPCAERIETIKPNQLISTRKGFRTRKRLSPTHGNQKFEPKTPIRVDRGLSPIAVFTAGPSGIDKEESEYFVQTYDAPVMKTPDTQSDKFSNKSTEMSPNTTFETKHLKESSSYVHKLDEIKEIKQTEYDQSTQKVQSVTTTDEENKYEPSSPIQSPQQNDSLSDISSKSHVKIENSITESLLKVEKSTSPFSDLMLDTGIGTDSPVTADTASSPFLLDVQSPSSLTFQSSSALMPKENCSTQTIQVEMLSAHTSPIDGPFSLQDSNLSFCPTESSLKSDSLDDLSKTLGTPSSDVVEPVAVLDFSRSLEEQPSKSSVREFLQERVTSDLPSLPETDDVSSSSREHDLKHTDESVTLNKFMVIESFRNVFATEPPFAIVASKKSAKSDLKKKKRSITSEMLAEDRLFTLHDQLLSEESALESSTDSGVDLKESSQICNYPLGVSDNIEASSSKEDGEDKSRTQSKTGSFDIEQCESEAKTPLSEQYDILPEDLSEVEKQIIPEVSDYGELQTDIMYVQDVFEPSIEKSSQELEAIKSKKSGELEYDPEDDIIDVVEEFCVKTKAYSYTGHLDSPQSEVGSSDISKLVTKEKKRTSVSDKSQKKSEHFVEDVEEQILSSIASRRFVSPVEIDRSFAQQIFSDSAVESNVVDSSANFKSSDFDSQKPIEEKSIVPKVASLDYYDTDDATEAHDIRTNMKPLVFKETDVKFSVENQFSNIDEKRCHSSKTFSDLSDIMDNKVLMSEAVVLKHERRSLSQMEETSFDSNWEHSNSTDLVFKEKSEFEGPGQATHLIQKTTQVTMYSSSEAPCSDEGGLPSAVSSLGTDQEKSETPESPELSFAEKRDFFQKLSETSVSSSANVTPTHTLKGSTDGDGKTETLVTEELGSSDSPEEQLSFKERLKFFEKSGDSPSPKMEIKDIKKEVWTVVGEDGGDSRPEDSVSDVSDLERERDFEVIEVQEKRRSTVSIDEQVSLPLYESKEVFDTVFDSTKDAKVEVVVKTFTPGSEMLEICSVENIPHAGDETHVKRIRQEEVTMPMRGIEEGVKSAIIAARQVSEDQTKSIQEKEVVSLTSLECDVSGDVFSKCTVKKQIAGEIDTESVKEETVSELLETHGISEKNESTSQDEKFSKVPEGEILVRSTKIEGFSSKSVAKRKVSEDEEKLTSSAQTSDEIKQKKVSEEVAVQELQTHETSDDSTTKGKKYSDITVDKTQTGDTEQVESISTSLSATEVTEHIQSKTVSPVEQSDKFEDTPDSQDMPFDKKDGSSKPDDQTDHEEEDILSNEEFISKTFKTITESSYEVSRSTVGAFKKDAVDKVDNKWQRESPDNISIVKDTMEPSLGKSEIFICTEETLDNVKKILSVADAESNVVINENEASSSTTLPSQVVEEDDDKDSDITIDQVNRAVEEIETRILKISEDIRVIEDIQTISEDKLEHGKIPKDSEKVTEVKDKQEGKDTEKVTEIKDKQEGKDTEKVTDIKYKQEGKDTEKVTEIKDKQEGKDTEKEVFICTEETASLSKKIISEIDKETAQFLSGGIARNTKEEDAIDHEIKKEKSHESEISETISIVETEFKQVSQVEKEDDTKILVSGSISSSLELLETTSKDDSKEDNYVSASEMLSSESKFTVKEQEKAALESEQSPEIFEKKEIVIKELTEDTSSSIVTEEEVTRKVSGELTAVVSSEEDALKEMEIKATEKILEDDSFNVKENTITLTSSGILTEGKKSIKREVENAEEKAKETEKDLKEGIVVESSDEKFGKDITEKEVIESILETKTITSREIPTKKDLKEDTKDGFETVYFENDIEVKSTKIYLNDEVTEMHLEEETREKETEIDTLEHNLKEKTTKEDLEKETLEKDLLENATEKDLGKITSEKELEEETIEKDFEKIITEKDLDEKTTEKDFEQIITEKDLDEKTTEQNFEKITSEKDLDEKKTEKDLQKITSEKDLQEKKIEKPFEKIISEMDSEEKTIETDLQKITSEKGLEEKTTVKVLQTISSEKDLEEKTTEKDLEKITLEEKASEKGLKERSIRKDGGTISEDKTQKIDADLKTHTKDMEEEDVEIISKDKYKEIYSEEKTTETELEEETKKLDETETSSQNVFQKITKVYFEEKIIDKDSEDKINKKTDGENSPDDLDIEALRAKIQSERDLGLQFEESFTRSVGSNEEKSESCFSSLKDQSVEIEFVPNLEVTGDVSEVGVDRTGHEASGTPCSFHKEMDFDDKHSDLGDSFEEIERNKIINEFKLEKKSPTVEKAEYEAVEKKEQTGMEEKIYKESVSDQRSGKETVHSVEVTQFKEHSTEVYNVPSERLIEKFSSKRIHIESSSDKAHAPHKMNQFLESMIQQDEGASIALPLDVTPVHKRTEEWIDQSEAMMLLREGAMVESSEMGMFEDRPQTLEDEPHKRSSPTAESFDDKARVEQCDTDVMMQLMDFVSRNDIELAEVRTEDEAPDIEEDVSPTAEEEICSRISYEDSKAEERSSKKEVKDKQQECLKVIESDNLQLSPQRSSFDSVTSPSRKEAGSDTVETIVDARYRDGSSPRMYPQSSLEVEVGSHDSEEVGTRDPDREMTPLSFVEEESLNKVDLASEKVGTEFRASEAHEYKNLQESESSRIKTGQPLPTDAGAIETSITKETIAEIEESFEDKRQEGSSFGTTGIEPDAVDQTSAKQQSALDNMAEIVAETSLEGHLPQTPEQTVFKIQQTHPESDVPSVSDQMELGKVHDQKSHVESIIAEEGEPIPEIIPCAFDNTAFAGTEVIDEVDQIVPTRARSPYEVIRDDDDHLETTQIQQTSGQDLDSSGNVTKTTYVYKQTEIRHRPILQHIPSEISEEDLVEREIVSPIWRRDSEGLDSPTDPESRRFGSPQMSSQSYMQTYSCREGDLDSAFEGGMPLESGIWETERTVRTTVTRVSSTVRTSGDVEEPVRTTVTKEILSPESDTGLPTSPLELASETEVSDRELKSSTFLTSSTFLKSEDADKSQDSVMATTTSQSLTEKTLSVDSKCSNGFTPHESKSDSQTGAASTTGQFSSGVAYETSQITETTQVLNGPGEVDYHPEYDYSEHEYRQTKRTSGGVYHTDRPLQVTSSKSDEFKKRHYSSVSDDMVDSEIGDILRSDQHFDDIIERPLTPEPPIDDVADFRISSSAKTLSDLSKLDMDEFDAKRDFRRFSEEQISPPLSPDDSKAGFAYGMQFEKDILDAVDEAMDHDSDPFSEEKEPVFAYGMRFEREPDMEDEDIPCYGDLYTHEEEDEDALENGDKIKVIPKPKKEAEFDILAGRKYFSKNVEMDELSMSSLQEFERLEAEIVSGRKSSVGSIDSLNGKIGSKSGDHDDVSMSSLTEFERLERECIEVEKINPAMQESTLSEIEEGHESQASETSLENKSEDCKDDLSIAEGYDHHLDDIEKIILKADGSETDELSFQYLIKQTSKSSTIMKGGIGKSGDSTERSLETTGISNLQSNAPTDSTIVTRMHVLQRSQDSLSKSEGRNDDIDQDSLHDESSLRPDSLAEDNKHEFLDSLHEGRCDDVDSLQGDIPDELRDSLYEDRHIEDDSLRDMDILPDESSVSMESSLAAVISHDSNKDGHTREKRLDTQDQGIGYTLPSKERVASSTSIEKRTEIIVSELPKCDVMLSSTDSLEQSSSAAAAFHFESESAMSTSLTGVMASEDNTMISSTDTLEHEGRITFRYEDIPIDDLEILIKDGRQVIVDSEGNVQTEYDVKHFLDNSQDNLNNEFTFCSKDMAQDTHPSSGMQVESVMTSVRYTEGPEKTGQFHTSTDGEEHTSRFESDPDIEIEEIHTTDEFGNPKVIKRMKKVVQTRTQYSSSSSSGNVEEKLKEFLREHGAGEGAGVGEEVVQEERSIDDKGNVVLVRTVQQQVLSEPEVHSRTFTGPDAAALSEEYVERFKEMDPIDDVCEYEKIDEQGNIVRVTQQVTIKPEMHSISFSGPNAHQQMEEYMKRFSSMPSNGSRTSAGESSQSFSGVQLSTSTEQAQEYIPSAGDLHGMSSTSFIKTTVSSLTPESSEQIVVRTTTTSTSISSADGTVKTNGSSDQKPPSVVD